MAERSKNAGPSRVEDVRADGAEQTERGAEPRVTGRDVAKRFVGYYRPFKFLFWFDLVCATVLACIDLAFPQFLNFFTKEFFLQPAAAVLASLGWILALFVALYAVRTACQYFITAWGHIMGARMEANMRRDLYQQYQRLSFSYYDRHNTGVMMSKIVNDLFDISELAHHGPENLFICLLKIIGSFALLFLVNVPLTAIMLAATVLMAVYSVWRNYKKRVIFTENRRKMADINAQLQDSLGGIRVVKSFGNEGVELGKFDASNRRFVATKESSYRFMGSFHAVNSVFTGVLYTITVVGGGYFVATGGLAVTDLAIYALYIGIFLSPIEQLINFVETFQKGYAGFRRFAEVLASRREAIGIVQQDVYLFGGTIRDNIAYGKPDATDEEVREAARKANILEFVEDLPDGFDTQVGERGARLSGGQKQRIAIARVFLRDPRILILDEATSALDNESERAVQHSLAELSRGRTTLIIAHRLSTIRGADAIAVVDEGRVVEFGTHDELLARGGTYAKYYKLQFGE